MDTNLKNITKLCKDIHTICQNGTPNVRVAAQLGLQDLYDKLTGLPKPLSSPGSGERPKGQLVYKGSNFLEAVQALEQKDLASKSQPTTARATVASVAKGVSPSDSILQPKNANPSVIPFKALSKEDLTYIGKHFEKKIWANGSILFNQGDDRKFFYMIESGTVEKFKIVFGKRTKLIDLGKYDTIGEEIFLDKTTHSASAQCLSEVTTWVLSNESWDVMQEENPKLAIKLMKNAANVMRYRLLYPAKAYIAVEDFARRADVRHEKDSIGEFELPSQAYYGVQTARAIENFPITGIKLCQFPRFIEALCYIKKAAAITNHRLGAISEDKRDAIGAACDEIVGGKLHGHFVVDMVQGGAGTSTNMNANEVIANRGLELMGKQKGQYDFLHPNNDVNHAQSTNDVYPSAIHIATLLSVPQLDSSLEDLANALSAKAKEFADILKMGRTQLQDAVPMTLGQAFEAWAQMIRDERERLKSVAGLMEEINMGATAIGTGINAHPAYSGLVIYELNQLTGLHLRPSPNLIMATQDTGAFLNFSSFLKNCCVRLSKISNDLRLLSSGPRCGLGEINLPAVQPGSSIMPGKVNPVIPEVVNQTSFFVMGADFANTMASEAGQMELNAMEPLMAFLIFQSIDMISSAIATLIRNCIVGITPNIEKCTWYVMNSTGIVTALNPYIGYDNASRIAKTSLKTGKRVYDLVLEEKLLSKEQLDEIMQPDKMTKPREISKNKHWRKLSNTLESVSFFFKELESKKTDSEQKDQKA